MRPHPQVENTETVDDQSVPSADVTKSESTTLQSHLKTFIEDTGVYCRQLILYFSIVFYLKKRGWKGKKNRAISGLGRPRLVLMLV